MNKDHFTITCTIGRLVVSTDITECSVVRLNFRTRQEVLWWPKRWVQVHRRWRLGFDYKSVRGRFAMDKVAMGLAFDPSTSVFPCQYHSTIAPYPFIHLPPTLYNVFLLLLQSPPVSTFHHCSVPIFIYMLLLTETQMGQAWEPFKSGDISEIGCIQ